MAKKVKEQEGEITFETGSMTKEELEAVLNTLPVDVTFVDKEDTVRYFSQPKERLFPGQRQLSAARCSNATLRKAYMW